MTLEALAGHAVGPATSPSPPPGGGVRLATGDDPGRWRGHAPPGFAAVALFAVAPAFLGDPEVAAPQPVSAPRRAGLRLAAAPGGGGGAGGAGRGGRGALAGIAALVSFEVAAAGPAGPWMTGMSSFLLSAGAAAASAEEASRPWTSARLERPGAARPAARPGEAIPPLRRSVSRADLVRYAAATGDANPIHQDHRGAGGRPAGDRGPRVAPLRLVLPGRRPVPSRASPPAERPGPLPPAPAARGGGGRHRPGGRGGVPAARPGTGPGRARGRIPSGHCHRAGNPMTAGEVQRGRGRAPRPGPFRGPGSLRRPRGEVSGHRVHARPAAGGARPGGRRRPGGPAARLEGPAPLSRRGGLRHLAAPHHREHRLDSAQAGPPPRRRSSGEAIRGPRPPARAGRRTGETRAGLRRALAALTPGQRAVVVLRDVYGWSNAETARELGITEITAKVRLHRARLRLRTLLEAAR